MLSEKDAWRHIQISYLEIVIPTLVGIALSGFLLWCMIKWLDDKNEKNRLLPAFGWSIITAGWLLWPHSYFGICLGAVVLLMVLLRYYSLSFLRSFFIAAVLMLIQGILRYIAVNYIFYEETFRTRFEVR